MKRFACLVVALASCRQPPPAPQREPERAHASDAARVRAPEPDAGMPTSPPAAHPSTYEGHADGRGVEPPIHEFAAHVQADSWTGRGTVRLDMPASDGDVSGTLALGGLAFVVHGHRARDHVRAAIDQVLDVDASSSSPDAADPAEARWRGTLDATLASGVVRGTWDASSLGGAHRREGTIEAQAAQR